MTQIKCGGMVEPTMSTSEEDENSDVRWAAIITFLWLAGMFVTGVLLVTFSDAFLGVF